MEEMKATFIVEKGLQGDDNSMTVNLNGITNLPCDVPTFLNYRQELPSLGMAHIFKEDGVLKATMEITDNMLNLYPAIGFVVTEVDTKCNTARVLELNQLGLCGEPNADPSIKTIGEQLNKLL